MHRWLHAYPGRVAALRTIASRATRVENPPPTSIRRPGARADQAVQVLGVAAAEIAVAIVEGVVAAILVRQRREFAREVERLERRQLARFVPVDPGQVALERQGPAQVAVVEARLVIVIEDREHADAAQYPAAERHARDPGAPHCAQQVRGERHRRREQQVAGARGNGQDGAAVAVRHGNGRGRGAPW